MNDVFVAAIVHMVHTIWTARNNLQFSSDIISLHATKSKIVSSIALNGRISKGNCLTADVALLDSFMIAHVYQRFKDNITIFENRLL